MTVEVAKKRWETMSPSNEDFFFILFTLLFPTVNNFEVDETN
ncbi:hypothetical protein SVR5_01684 [Glaesserella parasuis 29755]|nr:hypothetical protein SVR5_01684 [Glaesserella parasuis 29755]